VNAPAARRWRALGTGITVAAVDAGELPRVAEIAGTHLDAIDRSCSRFRADSELMLLPSDGRPHQLSDLLFSAIDVALRAARITEGVVDPTVAPALSALGYDRDFDDVIANPSSAAPTFIAASGWESVHLDRDAKTVTLPPGVALDLGATAKGLAADQIAELTQQDGLGGVLISLGGDMAVSGTPPEGGWRVGIGDNHAAGDDVEITLSTGGLATSSTTVRRWRQGGVECHHIVDPRTGRPAAGPWRTVSVAALTCVDANTASTAAIVLGEEAPKWLEERELPARLVGKSGRTLTLCGWPSETVAAHSVQEAEE
jgi:FAD:protein FMN transferase